MKMFILIVIWVLLVFCSCGDGSNFYDYEIVVNRDCTTGSENAGVEFDLDSIRCGRKSNIYFGLDGDETTLKRLFLFYDSDAQNSKDSLWILETDSAKLVDCKKLEHSNEMQSGLFCLKEFGNTANIEPVNYYLWEGIEGVEIWDVSFVYSKYGSYKALCHVESGGCVLRYSCSVRYDGSYNFSKVPNLNDVERNENSGCYY